MSGNSNTAGNFFAGNGLFTPPVGSGAPPRKGDPKDPLVLRLRLALETMVGASSKNDLEATKHYLESTQATMSGQDALLNAVNLLLEMLDG